MVEIIYILTGMLIISLFIKIYIKGKAKRQKQELDNLIKLKYFDLVEKTNGRLIQSEIYMENCDYIIKNIPCTDELKAIIENAYRETEKLNIMYKGFLEIESLNQ